MQYCSTPVEKLSEMTYSILYCIYSSRYASLECRFHTYVLKKYEMWVKHPRFCCTKKGFVTSVFQYNGRFQNGTRKLPQEQRLRVLHSKPAKVIVEMVTDTSDLRISKEQNWITLLLLYSIQCPPNRRYWELQVKIIKTVTKRFYLQVTTSHLMKLWSGANTDYTKKFSHTIDTAAMF